MPLSVLIAEWTRERAGHGKSDGMQVLFQPHPLVQAIITVSRLDLINLEEVWGCMKLIILPTE